MTGRSAVNFQWFVQRLFNRTYYYIFHDYIFFNSWTCEKIQIKIEYFRFFFIFYIFESIMNRIVFFILYRFFIIIFIRVSLLLSIE